MLRLLFPLIIGVVLAQYFNLNHLTNISFLLCFFVIQLLLLKIKSFRYRWLFGLNGFMFLMAFGYFLNTQNNDLQLDNHYSKFLTDEKQILVLKLLDFTLGNSHYFIF